MNFNAPAKLTVIISVILAIIALIQQFTPTNFLGLNVASYIWAGLAWLVLALGVVLKGM